MKKIAVLILVIFYAGCESLSTKAPERPNIVLIMVDDMGFSDIGCYGSEIATPNLDLLAAKGIRFTQFYNTARCCPTRASLMTGLYPHQAGVGHMMSDRGQDGYRGDLNEKCATIAEVLAPAGYATYMSGKWHVTRQTGLWSGDEKLTSTHNWPCQRGFDRFYGTIHGAGSYYDPVSLTRDNTPIEAEGDFYYTDAISDNAVKFIEEHEGNNPFFCYVAYTAPHWPMHALPEDIAKYKGRYDEGWDVIRKRRHQRMIELGIIDPAWKITERDSVDWEEAKYKHWHRAVMEVYAAMIDRVDQGIGRIVKALEKKGKLENTILFFLSDNGGCAEGGTAFEKEGGKSGLSRKVKVTRNGKPVQFGHYATVMPGPADTYQEYGRPWANVSNTPFRRYKHWVHEGGIASPFIVYWPAGIEDQGAIVHEPAHVIDIMATCVDLARAKYPSGNLHPMEGKSLVPAFDGKVIEREAIYWEHEGNRAVRRGRWKLVAKGRKGAWELYDMVVDRTETNDLSGEFPERVKEMSALWQAWAERAHVLPWPN
jgi:arylsulfatase